MNLYRHKKTGNTYAFICHAINEATMRTHVIYEEVGPEEPRRWSRPLQEFFDGRFEKLDVTSISTTPISMPELLRQETT